MFGGVHIRWVVHEVVEGVFQLLLNSPLGVVSSPTDLQAHFNEAVTVFQELCRFTYTCSYGRQCDLHLDVVQVAVHLNGHSRERFDECRRNTVPVSEQLTVGLTVLANSKFVVVQCYLNFYLQLTIQCWGRYFDTVTWSFAEFLVHLLVSDFAELVGRDGHLVSGIVLSSPIVAGCTPLPATLASVNSHVQVRGDVLERETFVGQVEVFHTCSYDSRIHEALLWNFTVDSSTS